MKLSILYENDGRLYTKESLTPDQIQAIHLARETADQLTAISQRLYGIEDAVENQKTHVNSVRQRLSNIQSQEWFQGKEAEQTRLENEWNRTYNAYLKLASKHKQLKILMRDIQLKQDQIGHDDLFDAIFHRGQGELYWV